jgi:hypothetical protein
MNLPPINYLRPGQRAPEISVAAALAPARGMEQVGAVIASMGEKGFQIANQVRESKEAGIRSDIFNQIDTEATNFKNGLLKRSDYDAWGNEFSEMANGWESLATEKGLSPAGKAIFQQQYSDWRTKQLNQIATTAALKSVQDGRLGAMNTIQRGAANLDSDAVERGVSELGRMGASPAEVEQARMDAEATMSRSRLTEDISSDPAKFKERLEDPDAIRREYPGVSTNDIERAKDQARAEQRQASYDIVDTFENGVADGTITSPEQIDSRPEFAKASPALKAKMKSQLLEVISDKEKARMDSPAYQAETVGSVSARLDNYVPSANDDVEYFELKHKIKTLHEGATKDRLTERLEGLRKGALDDWKTGADVYRAQLKQAFQDEAFGSGVSRQPLNEVIATGLLNDELKIAEQGFSEEQTKMILSGKADASDLKAMGVSEKRAEELAKGSGAANQIALLRELHPKRTLFAPEDADPYVRAAFDAIVSGKEGYVEYPNRAAKREAERKYGAVVSEFEKRVRLNPEKAADIFKEVTSPYEEEINRASLFGIPGENEATDQLLPPKE